MSYWLEEELTLQGVDTKTTFKIRFNNKIYVRVKTLPRQFYEQGQKLKEEYAAQNRDSLLIQHKNWIAIWLEELNPLEESEKNYFERRPEIFSSWEEGNGQLTDLPGRAALEDEDSFTPRALKTKVSVKKEREVAEEDKLDKFLNSSHELERAQQLEKKDHFFWSLLLRLMLVPSGKIAQEPASWSESEQARFQANLGTYYWQKGDLHQAISAWSKEAEIYGRQGLTNKEAETSLKIAQGNIRLGQLGLAIIQLETLLSLIKEPALTARTWEQLGNAYSRSGLFSEAISAYKKSLGIETSLSTLNNLVILLQKQNFQAKWQAGNSRKGEETESYLAAARSYQVEALEYAKQALSFSQTEQSSSSVRALIEWSKVSLTGLSPKELVRGRRILEKLPSSRTKVFLAINWAKVDRKRAKYWLSQATEVARKMGDERAESYAVLELGFMAEKLGNFAQALEHAQFIQLKAQSQLAYGSLYRAQWLAGRIYQKMENKEAAIVAYRHALASLEAFNQGLVTIDVERRADFSRQIEPIYRGMLKLLLDSSAPRESSLEEALFIFKQLRLAQRQNYFGDNCFEREREIFLLEAPLSSRNVVSINSIILDEQTHWILQLPDGKLHYSKTKLVKEELNKMTDKWYKDLKRANNSQLKLKSSYFSALVWGIFEQELERTNPATVIFVHDGIWRNLPMAVVYKEDSVVKNC